MAGFRKDGKESAKESLRDWKSASKFSVGSSRSKRVLILQ